MEKKIRNDFKGEDEPGIRYSMNVGYRASKENKRTIKEFCDLSEDFDGVRVSTIRYLLDMYDMALNHDALRMQIAAFEDRVTALELLLNDFIGERQAAKSPEQKEKKGGVRTFADPRGE